MYQHCLALCPLNPSESDCSFCCCFSCRNERDRKCLQGWERRTLFWFSGSYTLQKHVVEEEREHVKKEVEWGAADSLVGGRITSSWNNNNNKMWTLWIRTCYCSSLVLLDGINYEELTCPVLMMNRGLAHKALNSFPTSSSEIFCDDMDFIIGCIFCRLRTCSSVENIYALGNKGSLKTLRSSQEEEL